MAYVLLGIAVSPRPPTPIDTWAASWVGAATPLAILATESGLFPVYAAISVVALIAGLVRRAWLGRAIFAVVALVVTWQVSDLLKNVFRRPRPEHWIWHHEPSYSYSSGHAALSLTVYGVWAWFMWSSDLPRPVRLAVSVALGLWVVVIDWSRLALGAHYPTDVLGGVLLGLGMLALYRAVVAFFGDVRLSVRTAGSST